MASLAGRRRRFFDQSGSNFLTPRTHLLLQRFVFGFAHARRHVGSELCGSFGCSRLKEGLSAESQRDDCCRAHHSCEVTPGSVDTSHDFARAADGWATAATREGSTWMVRVPRRRVLLCSPGRVARHERPSRVLFGSCRGDDAQPRRAPPDDGRAIRHRRARSPENGLTSSYFPPPRAFSARRAPSSSRASRGPTRRRRAA